MREQVLLFQWESESTSKIIYRSSRTASTCATLVQFLLFTEIANFQLSIAKCSPPMLLSIWLLFYLLHLTAYVHKEIARERERERWRITVINISMKFAFLFICDCVASYAIKRLEQCLRAFTCMYVHMYVWNYVNKHTYIKYMYIYVYIVFALVQTIVKLNLIWKRDHHRLTQIYM